MPFSTVALGAEKGEAEVSPKKAWTVKDGALGISGCLGFLLVPVLLCDVAAVRATPPAF